MNVLAFDTCLGAVSVALAWTGSDGTQRLSCAYEERQNGHAERLFPMIQAVLSDAGLTFADIARVAITIGPGTFTGVRTGVAAARGLALASGCAVVGLTSLEIMAHRARRELPKPPDHLAVAVDARRGQVYLQTFGQGVPQASSPELLPVEDATARLAGLPWLLVGSGARPVAEAAGRGGTAFGIALERLEPDARSLAELAPSLSPLATVRPLYIRPPDAKPPAPSSLRA